MSFNKLLHTKQYLLSNPKALSHLSDYSHEFAVSELAQDFEILSFIIDENLGTTTAHSLAKNHEIWMYSKAANELEILSLKEKSGNAVVHNLAWFQPNWLKNPISEDDKVLNIRNDKQMTVAHYLAWKNAGWLNSESSKRKSILMLRNSDGLAVAHLLAQFQNNWCEQNIINDLDILLMNDKNGQSVAELLITEPERKTFFPHSLLFDKRILTKEYRDPNSMYRGNVKDHDGKLIGEILIEKHGRKFGIHLSDVVIKCISQGAGYKHTKLIPFKTGELILDLTKDMLSETSNSIICMKIAQAAYSTFAHNLNLLQTLDTQDEKNLRAIQKWKTLVDYMEKEIRTIHTDRPTIFDDVGATDLLCEPANELAKRLIAEKSFSMCVNEMDVEQAEKSKSFTY